MGSHGITGITDDKFTLCRTCGTIKQQHVSGRGIVVAFQADVIAGHARKRRIYIMTLDTVKQVLPVCLDMSRYGQNQQKRYRGQQDFSGSRLHRVSLSKHMSSTVQVTGLLICYDTSDT